MFNHNSIPEHPLAITVILSCFLAHHHFSSMAVYLWALAPYKLIPLYLESIPLIDPATSQCSHEEDRATLFSQINREFVSVAAFQRFAKFSALLLIVRSFLLSPAVLDPKRVNSCIRPFLDLATKLDFTELRQAFDCFDPIEEFEQVRDAGNPANNQKWRECVHGLFATKIDPLFQNEKAKAIEKNGSVECPK